MFESNSLVTLRGKKPQLAWQTDFGTCRAYFTTGRSSSKDCFEDSVQTVRELV